MNSIVFGMNDACAVRIPDVYWNQNLADRTKGDGGRTAMMQKTNY